MRVSVIFLAFLLAGCSRESPPIIQVTTEEQLDKVLRDHEVVLVDFGAEWCGPCQKMRPIVRKLERDYRGQVAVVEVDIDQARALARKYSVSAVPSFLVFRGGEVKEVIVGMQEREDLEDALKKALRG
jgi:thioredoxin 1